MRHVLTLIAQTLRRPPRAVRPAIVQVALTSAVVVSFLVSTALGERRSDDVQPLLDDIAGNAMPAIEELTWARRELRRIAALLGAASEAPRPETLAALRDGRDRLHAALARYLAVPFFEGEHALWEAMQRDRAGLDAAIDLALAAPPGVDVTIALAEAEELVAATDAALDDLVLFNVAHGRRAAAAIARARAAASRVTFVAESMSVLLAGIAACVAVIVQRRVAREVEGEKADAEARARSAATRADELEIFAARVAHDLLSSLSATSNALAIVQGAAPADDRIQRAVSRGASGVIGVRRIVDGLLQFARADAAGPSGGRAHVRDVVRCVLDASAADAAEHGVALAEGPLGDCYVACSEGVLTSLVTNLVANAIRYALLSAS